MNFTTLILTALLIEAVVTNITWVVEKEFDWKRLVAILVSVAFCVLANFDAFASFGYTFLIPYVGSVFTGLLIARGANGLKDLTNLITEYRKSKLDSSDTKM